MRDEIQKIGSLSTKRDSKRERQYDIPHGKLETTKLWKKVVTRDEINRKSDLSRCLTKQRTAKAWYMRANDEEE